MLHDWPQVKKKNHFEVLSSHSTQQQRTISLSDCDVQWKVNCIQQTVTTSSVTGLWRRSRALPKAKAKVKVKSLSRVWLFATPWTVACTRLLCPWDFLGKSTEVDCHFLLQGIFPTQWSNPGLPHCRRILYQLRHKETGNKNQKAPMGWCKQQCRSILLFGHTTGNSPF